MAGSCVHGNEPSGFVKNGDCQFLKKDSALWNYANPLKRCILSHIQNIENGGYIPEWMF
jgi:hypothetical protein